MEDKKKNLAALIVAKAPPPPGASTGKESASEDGESGDSDMSDVEMAGQEVMDALKSGDAASFTDSLKSFIKLCSYDKSEEE